ncbi:ATP-grasp domain-containing protein [Chytridium lagenaria]|nr:ATP-grasp domain-containing protein [Chytridium lagenaria]
MAAKALHVLVLDDVGTPTLHKRPSYTDCISDNENVRLMIITSKGSLPEADRTKCLEAIEIERPTNNGQMELLAMQLHEKYRIDRIYTRQEDLILRGAHIRKALGLTTGLSPEDALLYRDKHLMKEMVQRGGFPVPHFRKILSPVDIIQFTKEHGYPVVVKPILGSASAFVRVLKTEADRDDFLEKRFYERIDVDGRRLEYSGDMMIEQYLNCRMSHVNGYARNGRIEITWPFRYISTNFDFTIGTAYGNVLVPKSDPYYKPMQEAAQRVLDTLPTPDHLIFHLEMFESNDVPGGFLLCEIAARRPGGSIGPLIDLSEGPDVIAGFPEVEFRLSIGLPVRHDRSSSASKSRCAVDDNFSVADLMVPLRIGRLISMPAPEECPIAGVTYTQFLNRASCIRGSTSML